MEKSNPNALKNRVWSFAEKEQNAFREALEKGTLSCLPDKEGYADTRNVYDPFSQNKDNRILGVNGILVRDFLKENGFKVSAVITWDEANKESKVLTEKIREDARQKREQGQGQSAASLAEEAIKPSVPRKPAPKRNQDVGMSLG